MNILRQQQAKSLVAIVFCLFIVLGACSGMGGSDGNTKSASPTLPTIQGTIPAVITVTISATSPSAQATLTISPTTTVANRPPASHPTVTTAPPSGTMPPPSFSPTSNHALLPPMGWDHYNRFGDTINATKLKAVADAMIANGMRDAGYTYFAIDDSWAGKTRNPDGTITVDQSQYPDVNGVSGIKDMADYVHARGFKFGLYTTDGPTTCVGGRLGSLGHEDQDVKTYASWGVDFIKIDGCSSWGGDQDVINTAQTFYNLSIKYGRPMVISIHVPGNFRHWSSLAQAGAVMWRVDGDICQSWDTQLTGFAQNLKCWNSYEKGIMNIIDDQNVALSGQNGAGHGHYSDLDMLEVGNPGLSFEEAKSHFSLWAMVAAPLLAGNDPTDMTAAGYSAGDILLNKEVIAIDQDPAEIQGKTVQDANGLQIWDKPLQGAGAHAVLFLNTSSNALLITVHWSVIGLTQITSLRDVWQHQNIPPTGATFNATIPAHGVMMLTVTGS